MRFGDFAAAFAAGVAKGAPAGYELGLKGRELEETRKYRESETARKTEADRQRNMRAIEKQMDAAQNQKIMGAAATRNAATNARKADIAAGTAATLKTLRGQQGKLAEAQTDLAKANADKAAGIDRGFNAALAAEGLGPGDTGALGAATTPAPTTQAPVNEYSDGAPYSSALGEFWGVEVPVDEDEVEGGTE